MPKRFMTVREVAKLLGVTTLTVSNWDQKGKLAAYRNPVNNYRLYKTEDVENLLKEIDQSKDDRPALRTRSRRSTSSPRKLKIDVL